MSNIIKPGDRCTITHMNPGDPLAQQLVGREVIVKEPYQNEYWLLKEPYIMLQVPLLLSGLETGINGPAGDRLVVAPGAEIPLKAIKAKYLRSLESHTTFYGWKA